MKKKTKYKSRLSDFLIVLVCLAVCAGSLYLFWHDLNKSSVRSDKNKIATIYFKQRIAQRKFNDRVVWERLSQSSPLYNEDTIRTADLAQAVVRFNDGTELNLGENTMLQLSYDEKTGLQVSVSGGDVQVDGTKSSGESGIYLKMQNGSVVQVDSGSRVALKTDSSGESQNIEVQSGSASIQTVSTNPSENGKSETQTTRISSGESVNVESDGKVSKNPIAVTSIPKNLNLLKMDEKPVSVKLEWNVAKEIAGSSPAMTESSESSRNGVVTPLRSVRERATGSTTTKENLRKSATSAGTSPKIVIQTSDTKDFSKIKAAYTTTADNFELPASDGTVYWRVFEEGNEDESVEGKINVKEIPEIALISPSSNSEINYRTSLPKVLFSWKGNDYAANYKVEISKNRDMTNPVVSEENIELTSISENELAEGTYFWRVTPFYTVNNIGSGIPSEVKSFTITKSENIKPPILTIPAENAKITYVDSKNPEKSYNLNFAWKSEIKNASYDLEIARDKNFSDIFYSVETESLLVSRKLGILSSFAIPDGTYYWRVTRKSSDADDVNPVSAVQAFTISKIAADKNRLVYPPENFSLESEQLANTKFIWRLSEDFEGTDAESVLQISKSANFDKIEKVVSTNATNTTLGKVPADSADNAENSTNKNLRESATSAGNSKISAGTYYWRVGVKTSDGIEALSDARMFVILQNLLPPKITLPSENATLLTYSEKPTQISWEKSNGADYYNVRVYDSNGKLAAEKNGVKQTNVNFVLPAQKYSVQVQAATEQTATNPFRASENANVSFSLRNPSPVHALSPSQTQIAGLSALRTPTQFTWQNGIDIPTKTQFVLYKIDANGTKREVSSISNAKSGITQSRLTEGNYSWLVRASTSNGIPLDSEEQKFTITKVPLLPQATLVQPEKDFTIGKNYLRKNRAITFSWKEVPGATDYIFVLFQKNADGSVKRVYSEKTEKTQVRFRKLSSLDIANFEWNVTAFSHAKDGFEEQQGEVSKGEFKISFDLPDKIKTIKPGKMYAE